MDADSKLIVNGAAVIAAAHGQAFMHGVAARLANRVQLTTDGHKAYLKAVGVDFDADYAMLNKILRPIARPGPL